MSIAAASPSPAIVDRQTNGDEHDQAKDLLIDGGWHNYLVSVVAMGFEHMYKFEVVMTRKARSFLVVDSKRQLDLK